jgi:hypothetical protein
MTTPAIFCLVTSRGRADCLLLELKRTGYRPDATAVLFVDRTPPSTPEHDRWERATYGAAAPSAGPIRGVLAGIGGVGRLVVPGLGPCIAAGAIIPALRQAGGADPGVAIVPALVRLGLAESAAVRYERRIRTDGHFLVVIQVADSAGLAHARTIVAETNGEDICENAGSASVPVPRSH